jgi:hypothetical protein
LAVVIIHITVVPVLLQNTHPDHISQFQLLHTLLTGICMLHKNAGLGDGQSVIEKVIDLLLKFQTSHGKTSGSSVISQECPC